MRFGMPDSFGLPSFNFSFNVPMPGAYPSDPVPGPSQPAAAALRRHRTREELRREREELRNGLGLLENALQEISNKEPDAPDDDDAAKTPTPPTPRPHKHARPRTTNNSNNRRGHRKNASRRVYVGNLPRAVTANEVHARFSKFGKLHEWYTSCCRGPNTRRPSDDIPDGGEYMASVEFVHPESAIKAIQKLHNCKWGERTVVVSFSPWDMPTGKRIRPPVLAPPPAIVDNRPTPFTPVRDRTVQRREQAVWRHAQDGRRRRDEKVEQLRAGRLKQTLGGSSFPFGIS